MSIISDSLKRIKPSPTIAVTQKARELKEKGECFYTIGSSGHESNAVFGNIFPLTDLELRSTM